MFNLPDLTDIIKVVSIFILVDLPYLAIIKRLVFPMTRDIQGGRDIQFRILAAIPVYIAMAILLLKYTTSPNSAALLGLCVYAVYDWTSYAILKDYRMDVAIIDTLWGGALFWIVRSIYELRI